MFLVLRTSLPMVLLAVMVLLNREAPEQLAMMRIAIVSALGLSAVLDVMVIATALSRRVSIHSIRMLGTSVEVGDGRRLAVTPQTNVLAIALEIFPRERTQHRATSVALGVIGLGVPLLVALGSSLAWLSGRDDVFGGVALAGAFVFVTSMISTRRHPLSAGSALERLRAPSWLMANWYWAWLIESLDRGQSLKESARREELKEILVEPKRPIEPLEMVDAVLALSEGEMEEGHATLDRVARSVKLPPWLEVDVQKHRASYAALVDRNLELANTLADRVRELQFVDWYVELPRACIALTEGHPDVAHAAMVRWLHGVNGSPRRHLLLEANRWILERLRAAGLTFAE